MAGLLSPSTPALAGVEGGGTSQPTFAHQGMALSPLRINTQAFGGKWMGMAAGEAKVRAPSSSVRSPEAFAGAATSAAGLHVVEVISKTLEVILAAELGSGGAAVVVCVHAKVMPGSGVVIITARSPDKALAAALAQFLATAIA